MASCGSKKNGGKMAGPVSSKPKGKASAPASNKMAGVVSTKPKSKRA